MVDEYDEPLLPKIHLRRPLHGREAFRPQNQIYERSKQNISNFLQAALLDISLSSPQVFTGQYMTSVVLALPLVFYFNHKNKAFWTGMGQVNHQKLLHLYVAQLWKSLLKLGQVNRHKLLYLYVCTTLEITFKICQSLLRNISTR